MLARAEADFEPHLPHRDRKQHAQIGRCLLLEIRAQARQQLRDEPLLSRAQALSLAPAIRSERSSLGSWAILVGQSTTLVMPAQAGIQ